MAKPAAGTALDTGHALYGFWAAVWALLEGDVGGTQTTSADNKGARTLTLSSSALWATNGAGENIIRIGAATAAPLALASALQLTGQSAGGTDWSIVFRARQANNDTLGMVCGDNTNTMDFVWMDGGSFLRFRDHGNADCDFNGVTNFTVAANYYLTWQVSAQKARLYKNGTEVNAGGLVSGAGNLNINTLGNGYTSTTLALVGDLEFVGVMAGHLLTQAEVTALDPDIYAIFQSGAAPTPAMAAGRRGRRALRHMLTR